MRVIISTARVITNTREEVPHCHFGVVVMVMNCAELKSGSLVASIPFAFVTQSPSDAGFSLC